VCTYLATRLLCHISVSFCFVDAADIQELPFSSLSIEVINSHLWCATVGQFSGNDPEFPRNLNFVFYLEGVQCVLTS
jgi:hypothetical protein